MLLAPRIRWEGPSPTAADPSELLVERACGSLGGVRIMISNLTPKNEGRQVNEEAPERSSLGLPLLGSLSAWRRRTKQKRLPANMSASILKAVRFRTNKQRPQADRCRRPKKKPQLCQLRGFSNAKTIRGSAVMRGYVVGTGPTGDETRSSF